jgi:hypothetical protein
VVVAVLMLPETKGKRLDADVRDVAFDALVVAERA